MIAGGANGFSTPRCAQTLRTMRPLIPISHLTAAPNPERQFRLMETVRRKLREGRYRRRTEEAYVHWIRRYIVRNERRHPRDLGETEVRRFLSGLAVEDRVAASTQNQALAALTFLYDRVLQRPLTRIEGIAPARLSRHVPVVLTPAEVRAILAKLDEPARLSPRPSLPRRSTTRSSSSRARASSRRRPSAR